jgi:ribosomal protein S6
VRAVENHGVRPLPFRIRSKYSLEGERYQSDARFVSLYYDAPVGTMADLEQRLKLNEAVLRCTTLRTPSVVDEVSKQTTAAAAATAQQTMAAVGWARARAWRNALCWSGRGRRGGLCLCSVRCVRSSPSP